MWRNAHLRKLIKSFYANWTGDLAAKLGALFVLIEWGNELPMYTESAMDLAASYGHLDVVKWLHANRTEGCTKWSMIMASVNGHLDVVKWLHTNRPNVFSPYAMGWAAENGHLDVAKWLKEHPVIM